MGKNDAHSPWVKLSFNIYKQLAICFYQLDPRETIDPGMPPPWTPRAGSVDLVVPEATAVAPSLPPATTITSPTQDTTSLVVTVAPSLPPTTVTTSHV